MKITPPISKKVTTITETSTHTISQETIISALEDAGVIARRDESTSVEAWVRVPGGGDWSNTNLELDQHPVVIKITKQTTKET